MRITAHVIQQYHGIHNEFEIKQVNKVIEFWRMLTFTSTPTCGSLKNDQMQS